VAVIIMVVVVMAVVVMAVVVMVFMVTMVMVVMTVLIMVAVMVVMMVAVIVMVFMVTMMMVVMTVLIMMAVMMMVVMTILIMMVLMMFVVMVAIVIMMVVMMMVTFMMTMVAMVVTMLAVFAMMAMMAMAMALAVTMGEGQIHHRGARHDGPSRGSEPRDEIPTGSHSHILLAPSLWRSVPSSPLARPPGENPRSDSNVRETPRPLIPRFSCRSRYRLERVRNRKPVARPLRTPPAKPAAPIRVDAWISQPIIRRAGIEQRNPRTRSQA
jgi:hypothetical protein